MIIRIPTWLFKLLFGKQVAELERRAKLTGKAKVSSSVDFGIGELTSTFTAERKKDIE